MNKFPRHRNRGASTTPRVHSLASLQPVAGVNVARYLAAWLANLRDTCSLGENIRQEKKLSRGEEEEEEVERPLSLASFYP